MEKVVASKQLRLAVETEERKAILDNEAATKWLRLAMEMDEERISRLDGSYQTAQVGHGDGRRKKSNIGWR